jgi:N-methylhydantoinase A
MPVAAEDLARIGKELAGQVDADLAADGVAQKDRTISLEADLRFVRQNWELSVTLDDVVFDETCEPMLRARFEEEYTQRYGAGSISMGTPVEVVAIRAVGTGPAEIGLTKPFDVADARQKVLKPPQSRRVRTGTEHGARILVGVVADDALQPGDMLRGPALIGRWDTSIWVPEGVTARRDGLGSIILEVP